MRQKLGQVAWVIILLKSVGHTFFGATGGRGVRHTQQRGQEARRVSPHGSGRVNNPTSEMALCCTCSYIMLCWLTCLSSGKGFPAPGSVVCSLGAEACLARADLTQTVRPQTQELGIPVTLLI